MLKRALLLLSVLILTAFFSFGVSAATKQDVIKTAESFVPGDYNFLYLIQFENILAQTDLSAEKYDRIIEIIEKLGKSVTDSGHSLHFYTAENQNYILEYFDEVCDICGFTYKYDIAGKSPQWHPGDVICMIYDSGGRLIGILDGDQDKIVNKTNTQDNSAGLTDSSLMLPLGAFGIMAVSAVVFIANEKRFKF